MAITSSTQLISCPPDYAVSNETVPPTLKLPHYMSGSRAKLFAELIRRGILTPEGKITSEYAFVSLPPLTTSEIVSLREELNREFEITLDEDEKLTLSVGTLLEAFQKSLPEQDNNLYIRSLRLIGGYATHILFSRTDYVKRVFDRFGLSELFIPDLIRKQEGTPADIDLRMHIERRPPSPTIKKAYPLIIEGYEFDQIRALIIDVLARMALQQNSSILDARKKIEQHAFSTLCKVDTGFNRMLVLSLKKSPVDWIIYHVLGRLCVFTIDDLYIPCEEIYERPPAPESHNSKPLESFLHCILGFIDCEKPETIDGSGWFRFISCLVKGYCCIQPGLEEKLFSRVNRSKHALNEQIEGWLKKHHPDNPLATLTYVLNSALLLKNRFKSEKITELLTGLLSSNRIRDEHTFSNALQKTLLNPNIPFNITISLLKLGAYLSLARSSPTHPDINLSIGTASLEYPTIQLHIGSYSFELDLKIAEDVKLFAVFYADKEVDADLCALFFLLCPPSEHLKIRYEGVDLDLSEISRIFCSHASPFLKYVGFLSSAATSFPSAQAIADRNLLNFINLSHDKTAMCTQLARVSGTLPTLDNDFITNWILTLLEPGRGSLEVGYAVWKESSPPLTFSLSLITRLASSNPELAIRMLTHLQTKESIEKQSLDTYCAIFETGGGSALLRKHFEEVLSFFQHAVLREYILLQIKQNATLRACFLLKLAGEKSLLNPEAEIELLISLLTKHFDTLLFDRLIQLCNDAMLLARVYPFPDESMLESPILQACAEGRIKITKQEADFHLSLCKHFPHAWRLVFPLIGALRKTPALIELKGIIVEQVVEDREFEKAFYLLDSLFLHFENRKRYYDLLAAVLLNGRLNPKKVFCLLSQIAKADKNACHPSLTTAIKALVSQHPVELSRWLKETDFFNSLKERVDFQTFLRDLCIYLLRNNAAKAGYYCFSLIKKYPQDIQDLEIIAALVRKNFLSTKEKFAFLDHLNPDMAKTPLRKVVVQFGIEMTKTKEGCKRFAEWLLTTPFFSTLPEVSPLIAQTEDVIADEETFFSSLEKTFQARENLRKVVLFTLRSLIYFYDEPNKEWASLTFTFFSHYLDDLRPLEQTDVQALFSIVELAGDPHLLLTIFQLIESQQLLPKTSDDFMFNFASTIDKLEADPEVLPLLQNVSRLHRFSTCLESQCEANFAANFCWLNAAFYWAQHNRQDIFSPEVIKQAYGRMQLALHQIRLPTTQPEVPLAVYSQREGIIDFLYLTYLYSHEDPQKKAEGKELFREKTHQLHPQEYWFGIEEFFNYLITHYDPKFQYEVDSLLELIQTVHLDKQTCTKLLEFLIQSSSQGRLIKASSIWIESIETRKIPLDQKAWEFGYKIIDQFFQLPNEPDPHHPFNAIMIQNLEIINTLYREYYAQYQDNSLYNIQIREVNLRFSMRHWENTSDQKLILQTLEGFFLQIKQFYADRNSQKALAVMPDAIVTIASFNPHKFKILADKYWNSITEIPLDEIRYNIRYIFIEILIDNKNRSPDVQEKARTYLNHLIREHREKRDAIRVLLEKLHSQQ